MRVLLIALLAAISYAQTVSDWNAFCSYPMWTLPQTGTDTRCDHENGCPKRVEDSCNDIYGISEGEQCDVYCNNGSHGTESWTCVKGDTKWSYKWRLSSNLLDCEDHQSRNPNLGSVANSDIIMQQSQQRIDLSIGTIPFKDFSIDSQKIGTNCESGNEIKCSYKEHGRQCCYGNVKKISHTRDLRWKSHTEWWRVDDITFWDFLFKTCDYDCYRQCSICNKIGEEVPRCLGYSIFDECVDVHTLNLCKQEVERCGDANVQIISETCPISFHCNSFYQTYAAPLESDNNNLISRLKLAFHKSVEQHLPISMSKMLMTSHRFFTTGINMGLFAFDRGKKSDE